MSSQATLAMAWLRSLTLSIDSIKNKDLSLAFHKNNKTIKFSLRLVNTVEIFEE